MINEIVAYFDVKPDTAYPVVVGNIHKDNYNEEIDSMTIQLDNVHGVIPFRDGEYHWVKIVNRTQDGMEWDGHNYIFMLVDNWSEELMSFEDDLYTYNINLMNIIKLFEKIQCPDLMITHSLVGGSKTIYQYIDQYMQLYCPKVKITNDQENYHYEYLFSWDNLNVSPFNNTIAADMQMNAPTLREVLTNLMIQVGCIPTVKYRTLSFIDFRAAQSTFTLDNTITSVKRSGASDSYANALFISPSQVIDDDNEVITETIGFRDKDNVLIKQTENLKLETRFPIYHITKATLKFKSNGFVFQPTNQSNITQLDGDFYPILGSDKQTAIGLGTDEEEIPVPFLDTSTGILYVKFIYNTYTMRKGTLRNVKFHFCEYNADGTYTEVQSSEGDFEGVSWALNLSGANQSSNDVHFDNAHYIQYLNADGTMSPVYTNTPISYNGRGYTYELSSYVPTGFGSGNFVYIWFEWEWVDSVTGQVYHSFVPMRKMVSWQGYGAKLLCDTVEWNSYNTIHDLDDLNYYDFGSGIQMELLTPTEGGYEADVTPCFVENSKRQLLRVDFDNIPTTGTMEYLATWLYGTVGYSIGSREISGFSDMYSKAIGWWDEYKTYIDNILGYIYSSGIGSFLTVNSKVLEQYSSRFGNMPTAGTLYAYSGFNGTITDKSKIIFNLTYQPLNNFKLKLLKKDRDIPIEVQQLNGGTDGLSQYERLLKNSQDIINRIGNTVLVITQRTDDISKIHPLNSNYNGYTIFQRSIEFREDYVQIAYIGSENYVMQNYFTSIVQKYRAYEYVDYNKSIVRKENTDVYIYLFDEREAHVDYNSDDYLIRDIKYNFLVFGGLAVTDYAPIKYVVKSSTNSIDGPESIKEEVSLLTNEDGFAIVYQDYDNVSAGSYIYRTASESGLGGIVQKWQMWNQDVFNVSHRIRFVSDIYMAGDIEIDNVPIVYNDQFTRYVLFEVASKNRNDFLFYKDNAEILNHTIQFTIKNKVSWFLYNKNFFRGNALIGKFDFRNHYTLKIYAASQYYQLQDKKHSVSDDLSDTGLSGSDVIVLGDTDDVQVNFNGYTDSLVFAYLDDRDDKIYDLCEFIYLGSNEGYISIYVTDTFTTNALYPISSGENSGLFKKIDLEGLIYNPI